MHIKTPEVPVSRLFNLSLQISAYTFVVLISHIEIQTSDK